MALSKRRSAVSLADLFASAFHALSAHRLRTSLSVLGIVVGVGAIVATISLVNSATAQMKERIAGLGIRTISISIFPGAIQSAQAAKLLTQELTDRLSSVAEVSLVVPIASSAGSITAGGQTWNVSLLGVTPEFPLLFDDFYPKSGRFIHELDAGRKVAVLGSSFASSFFGSLDPVGQSLTLELMGQKVNFQIVGVMNSRGTVGTYNLDNYIYVPLTTIQTLIGSRQFTTYIALAKEEEKVQEAKQGIESILAATFASTATAQQRVTTRTAGGSTRTLTSRTPYQVTVQAEVISTYEESVRTMTIVLGSVAAISLLVGGIGIMNIMLVSVIERTREIGIRMAIGAKPKDIRTQFLVEAVVICLLGGLLGLILGWATAGIGAHLGDWPFVFSFYPALLAVGFSSALGIIFGLYPAMRASHLDPVEALRYE